MRLLDRLESGMPEMPSPVLAGFSGGADSTALVLLLLKQREEKGRAFGCVHVHHGLRGSAADADEAFVRAVCREHGIPLRVFHLVPPAHPGEGWARRERYRCMKQALEEDGYACLALAHHAGDQAETVMLHILRGSGVQGLAGMRVYSDYEGMQVVRPLLGMTPGDLRSMLREEGQAWQEDATNAEDDYLRNRVRHHLLPQMELLAPGCEARLGLLAETAAREHDALETLAQTWPGVRLDIPALRLSALRSMPDGLRDTVLRRWWQQFAPERKERHLDQEHTRKLNALAMGKAGKRLQLPGGMEAVCGWSHLHLDGAGPLPVPEMVIHSYAGIPGDGKRTQAFPEGFLDGTQVRFRAAGDWIRPFGFGHCQSLQDYLVNRHVDAPFRDSIPLVCRGHEVLWVCGVGCGDVPRLSGAEKAVTAEWTGEILWL